MAKITKISVTNDKILPLGVLPLFLLYIGMTGLYRLISYTNSPLIIQGNKSLQLNQFLKQTLAFYMSGTSATISHFDQLSSLLENNVEELTSSHQVKRF